MTKSAVKFSIGQIQALKRIAQEKKLKGADVLNEYTDEQIAESFNGAGRDGFSPRSCRRSFRP